MLRKSLFLVSIFFVLVGCAVDPFTKLLKKNNYAPILPIVDMRHIGDCYKSKSIKESPYFLMRNITNNSEKEIADLNKWMDENFGENVVIENLSEEDTYELNADADLIGYAAAELKDSGVKRFKIKFKGCRQFVASTYDNNKKIYPKIKSFDPEIDYNDKYEILALLRVDSMEYEFYDQNKDKIYIQSKENFGKLKASLGGNWNETTTGNLSFSTPHFVGYRIYKVKEVPGVDGKSGLELKSNEKHLEVEVVNPDSIRRMYKKINIDNFHENN